MDREAWWATVHEVAKSRIRLTDIVNDNNNKGTNKDQQIYQGEKNMNELDQDTQEKINPRGNR